MLMLMFHVDRKISAAAEYHPFSTSNDPESGNQGTLSKVPRFKIGFTPGDNQL